jgi:AraC-like DNA-binding protein
LVAVIVSGSAIAVFACLLLLTKRPLADSDLIASVFILLLTLPMAEKLLLAGSIELPYLGFRLFSGAPLAFGPFLYLYARSVINPHLKRRARPLLHFLPFLASIGALMLPGATMRGENSAASMVEVPTFPLFTLLDIFIVLSFVIYTAKIFIMLRAHDKSIPDYFSKDSLAINLKWLGWITASFFVAYMLVIGWSQVFPGSSGIQVPEASLIRDIATVFFIVVFGFCAIKQPLLFKASPDDSGDSAAGGIEDPGLRKYEKSGLKEREALEYLAALEDYMRSRKPWLDPDLTIDDVASALAIQKHYITQIINERLGKNFYRYVNEYRVEEVKLKIASGEAERLSILGVALDAGFNSKSAFNEAFKGIMGSTPSDYRKSVRP